MHDILGGMREAFLLLADGNSELRDIALRSLYVSGIAAVVASTIGLPLGAILAVGQFRGRKLLIVISNTAMSLPPVVVGLVAYLALSRAGPLGFLGILFTPAAMMIAQTALVTPIIVAVSRQIIDNERRKKYETLLSLGANKIQIAAALLRECAPSLSVACVAGFGRALSEVGAVMIVGGNIEHATRVLTTAISMETGKGNLHLAVGLGIVLLAASLAVNAIVYALGARRHPQSTNPT